MRLAALFLSLCLLAPVARATSHSCPRGGYVNGIYNGSNTFYLEPSAWDLAPNGYELELAQTALRNQGYDAGSLNSFRNTDGHYWDTYTPLTIEQAVAFIQNPDAPIRVFVAYQHASGDPPILAWELYARTTPGQNTRDTRFTELCHTYRCALGGVYSPEAQIVKTGKPGPSGYWGIGVTPRFFQKIWKDAGIPGPDLMWIVGCNTGQSGWADLLTDADVRCLVTMNDSLFVQDETIIPWTRMDGRGWWGSGTSPKRLRTAPLAFTEEEYHNGQSYLRRYNPTRPLWDVNFADRVDSMALSPTLFSLDLAQNQSIGQNQTWVQAVFSCAMWKQYATAMVTNTHGAYVDHEEWTDDHTLRFSVQSVRVCSWSEVILRGMNDPYRYLCSVGTEGYRPICFSGHGPVGPSGHDSTVVVNTWYNDPILAAAYDGVIAWKDGTSTKVWVMGTEVGTTRHVILGGNSPEDLAEVGSIPGSRSPQAHRIN